jgi:transcription termination factor Rho
MIEKDSKSGVISTTPRKKRVVLNQEKEKIPEEVFKKTEANLTEVGSIDSNKVFPDKRRVIKKSTSLIVSKENKENITFNNENVKVIDNENNNLTKKDELDSGKIFFKRNNENGIATTIFKKNMGTHITNNHYNSNENMDNIGNTYKNKKVRETFFTKENRNKQYNNNNNQSRNLFEKQKDNYSSKPDIITSPIEELTNTDFVDDFIKKELEENLKIKQELEKNDDKNNTIKQTNALLVDELSIKTPIIEEQLQPLLPPETIEFNYVKRTKIEDLVLMAEKYNVHDIAELNRQNMVYSILRNFSYSNPLNVIIGEGVLETLQDGYGFLRSQFSNYVAGPDDIYVSPNQIKKFGLRTGDTIRGEIKAPKKGEKYFSLLKLTNVNNISVEYLRTRIKFEDLTPLYPNDKLKLEDEVAFLESGDDSSRIIDLITPMGKGQRALIVAPPKTGKTMLLQTIAHAIERSHPDAYLIVLLIDERPEEVTDMIRSVKGEVVSSTFDEPAFRHTQLAEIVIEKAKRLVEYKKDVIILLDSITRLARAYNNVIPSSGKVLTGGVDANALQKPKRFFGAARNIEEGGSLTIIATALVETGSKMDEVIFEEFKGTGNSEILLDRKISDKRIFPAVDITKSSTRKDDLLISKIILNKSWMIRKIVSNMSSIEAIEFLKDKMKATKNNTEFLDNMNN